jgi:hypothetical protein
MKSLADWPRVPTPQLDGREVMGISIPALLISQETTFLKCYFDDFC